MHLIYCKQHALKKMKHKTVKIEDIMSYSTLLVVVLKSFEINTFVMGYHA